MPLKVEIEDPENQGLGSGGKRRRDPGGPSRRPQPDIGHLWKISLLFFFWSNSLKGPDFFVVVNSLQAGRITFLQHFTEESKFSSPNRTKKFRHPLSDTVTKIQNFVTEWDKKIQTSA